MCLVNHFVERERDTMEEVDSNLLWDTEEIEDLRPGTNITVQVSVIEASGLPAAYSHNLFCQYKFWGQEDALIIPPLIPTGGLDVPTPVGLHQFQHTEVFDVEVTEEFLDYIEEGALAIEVWGHRRSGFIDAVSGVACVQYVHTYILLLKFKSYMYMYSIHTLHSSMNI